MRNWIGRLVAAVIAAVLALLAAPVTESTALAPAQSLSTYVYVNHHHPALVNGVVTERGPPETSDHVSTYDAEGHRSLGASARLNAAAALVTYDYDDLAPLVQIAPRSRGAEQVGSSKPASAVVERSRVAANGARVFASTDAHVASAANSIEAAFPGRVVGVNTQRAMSNGLTREVDIDLGDLLVQVTSGNARGLTGQIARTQASTDTRTIGYAPDISDAAWRNAAQQGIPILRSQASFSPTSGSSDERRLPHLRRS